MRDATLKIFLNTDVETDTMSESEKGQWLLDKSRIRDFADILSALYDARQKKMCKGGDK